MNSCAALLVQFRTLFAHPRYCWATSQRSAEEDDLRISDADFLSTETIHGAGTRHVPSRCFVRKVMETFPLCCSTHTHISQELPEGEHKVSHRSPKKCSFRTQKVSLPSWLTILKLLLHDEWPKFFLCQGSSTKNRKAVSATSYTASSDGSME